MWNMSLKEKPCQYLFAVLAHFRHNTIQLMGCIRHLNENSSNWECDNKNNHEKPENHINKQVF